MQNHVDNVTTFGVGDNRSSSSFNEWTECCLCVRWPIGVAMCTLFLESKARLPMDLFTSVIVSIDHNHLGSAIQGLRRMTSWLSTRHRTRAVT